MLALREPSEGGWPGTMARSSWLLEDADGSWTGEEHLFTDDATGGHGMIALTGHDAYDGLSAVLRVYTEDPDCTECLELSGYIFEAPLPPMPEPAEPSAE